MQLCQNIAQLRAQVSGWRDNKETIAFVPTMGNLHDGHLSLIKIAQQKASRVVVSIYVNPLQFSPDEDFDSYPRTQTADLDKLKALNVDLIFTPDNEVIYPKNEEQEILSESPLLFDIIEGEFRPGFFKGVSTVVLKLFNIVTPDVVVFGEKDFQQLLVIKKMVEIHNLPIQIIGGETIREPDGLAMSSRNNYLNELERNDCRMLFQVLQNLKSQVVQGVSVKQAEQVAKETLVNNGFVVDYVTLRETSALDEVSDTNIAQYNELIVLAAARIGNTRLIDNLKFII